MADRDNRPIPFRVSKIDNNELYALRALERGEATQYQQRLALSVIIKKLCNTYDVHFVPGQPDSSAFMEGRSYPGKKLLELLHIDPAKLVDLEDTNET